MMVKSISEIPEHLMPFVAKQNPDLYTAIDHAAWRYILRISKAFFSEHAHEKYLAGLKETGISTERIPLISEMDECLRKFGWRAVAVSGFIPPSAFMEFQSLGVLPIACDMRKLEHIAYTPAPDIVHEAAGHAPIIADPEYAAYLRAYGEVARKAIFSSKDMEVYEAIRDLSEVKEDPDSTPEQVQACQRRLDKAVAENSYVSEATYLARMNWWTVEYGLVGDLEDPKIYGAGLLSSVGESFNCLKSKVRKLPLTLDCVNMSYDITRPQPQLYVTPDFATLTEALEEFAETMGFRRGGIEALTRAKTAETVTTTVLDSEIQISGILDDFLLTPQGIPYYLKWRGPVQLAVADEQLEKHDPKARHPEGFSTPIGPLKNSHKTAAQLTDTDFAEHGFSSGQMGRLEFASGVVVEGELLGTFREDGKLLVATFGNCTVTVGSKVLYRPEWGEFDMACGGMVISVFGGAADRRAYALSAGGYVQRQPVHKSNLTEHNRELVRLYARVRELREAKTSGEELGSELNAVYEKLGRHSEDWLLRMELLELAGDHQLNPPWKLRALEEVQAFAAKSPENTDLIRRGIALLAPELRGLAGEQ